LEAVAPHSLLERFAAKKSVGVSQNKDFLSIKGQAGQIENVTRTVSTPNDRIGFKCLHYSVTESSGTIEVTVMKKKEGNDFSFGIRTAPYDEKVDTAKPESEYMPMDKIVEMKYSDKEMTFKISIIDNHDWQPDLDFRVELYDPLDNSNRFPGDDTITKITILDEDFPG
jgi:hypothetical protein